MTLSLPPCPPGVGAAVWRLAWAATVRTLLRGARLGQVGGPLRVAVVGGPDQAPVRAAGHRGHAAQGPAEFLDQPVGLAVVAAHAGGDAVLPGVGSASATRDHMIDGLGLDPAVP